MVWQEHGLCEIIRVDSMSIGQELQCKRADILRLADRHGASEVRMHEAAISTAVKFPGRSFTERTSSAFMEG